ncbi:hypothetical protein [Nocardioides sp. WS12]|uniref:hypothetical protein n=1 Tax=Nocardioides sp. WS12 TaxID=2486272 RepID=UPI0015FAC57A|nr:hypothetical protein [Nocardioides sp. WS12]
MGSFTEVCLSFDFVESAPEHVLAAFSALAEESPGAPDLPAPVVEGWELWEPDWRYAGFEERDPYEHEPWRHDWANAVSIEMSGGTTEHGVLAWTGSNWNLDCRFSWKMGAEEASEALEWLAPFVEPRLGEYVAGRNDTGGYDWTPNPTLVGYALDEGLPRPFLFWMRDGRWELEDLNPDDEFRDG